MLVREKEKAMTAAAVSAAKKVLVAEGDRQLSETIQALLSRQGFEVVLAREGREALRKVLTEKPDAILLDTDLAGAGQMDVCSMLKANKETSHIPLGFLTGEPRGEAQKTALLAGALILIPKPFKPEQLISSVGLLVSARRKKPAA